MYFFVVDSSEFRFLTKQKHLLVGVLLEIQCQYLKSATTDVGSVISSDVLKTFYKVVDSLILATKTIIKYKSMLEICLK